MCHWQDDLYLLTVDELAQLPIGIPVFSIAGNSQLITPGLKGINLDTRFGHTAWGVKDIANHPQKELLLMFQLKT
jgi:hypothetical protein